MKKFFDLSPSEQVEKIMESININRQKRVSLVDESSQEVDPFIDLYWKQREVYENSDPIPVPENARFRFLKRFIGKLIRTYTRKQVHFNQSTTGYLDLVQAHLRKMNLNHKEVTDKLYSEIIELKKHNEELAWKLSNTLNDKINKVERNVDARLVELEKRNFDNEVFNKNMIHDNERKEELNSAQIQNTREWIQSVEGNHNHLYQWTELIDSKVKNIEQYQDRTRKEIFAELKHSFNDNLQKVKKKVESKIVNRDKYESMMKNNMMKVNLGCGNLSLHDYINIDMRELNGVDIIADVTNVPLPEGTVDELYLAHVIEHFSEIDMEQYILKYWHSLLKTDGKIRIICPNWKAMIEGYSSGEISFDVLKEITFGSQEYEGNQHYNMFSPETLISLMNKIGFKDIKVVDEARKNGLCLEMEIEGVR
ncbi:hypothetical protein MH117_10960 [Paenibacillus sp. ACRRX]|uniref:class I SAM-dependent methyltransferase n=1 Tax=Paenibacillus sp. ACRRX TaxID=2918206 RepID=UPI001EF42A7E|nr:hypothetical protein [Paenibacillus sp. ACRRX]MCG7407940.1 hypothetical protein [Paenibacillus sp. ACRRX]